ncbi:MAG TPA: flagellar basal body rod protein FlgC [Gemmataceae bacterium]|nr:flagellar basal body rod protein FlgC [Gemmataceae bacterium]
MHGNPLFAAANISATGLAAERLRLEVVANNIANAFSTHSPNGGPYRRQDVLFSAVLKSSERGATGRRGAPPQPGGVQVLGIVDDMSAFHRVYNPGHPEADKGGYVNMPNVDLPVEMVNMITASRAYEANLQAMRFFRQMTEQSYTLLRNQGS